MARRIATAFLIAAWLLTPELLCLIPGVGMTAQEHQCCEEMAADCGKVPMPMPDMHKCCRDAVPSRTVVVARTADYSEFRWVILPAVIPDVDLDHNNAQSRHWLRFDNPISPPLISQDFTDILRI
jgi:hypothetical protein